MNIAEREGDPRLSLYALLIRPLLFRLEAERAHDLVAATLRLLTRLPGGRAGARLGFGARPSPRLAQTIAGVHFPAPIGVAAGLDKRGDLYPVLAGMGFGFVEVGTFTRQPQEGNPRPRMFRFAAERAIVNRMGFNNPGADTAARTLARSTRHPVPLGVSVGRSRAAAPDEAAEDQAATLRRIAPYGDYCALNVSSPNTPGLRAQQDGAALADLVAAARRAAPEKPLYLKLAPDLADARFDGLVDAAADMAVAGLILTNTTVSRQGVAAAAGIEGGLSGAPLFARSTELVRRAYRRAGRRLAIIAAGGVFSGPDALAKIRAGASLVQVYTGYVFEGPGLPRRIQQCLDRVCREEKRSLSDLVGSEADRRGP